jgi:C-terminal processing protease CtpA/Prc
MTKRLTAALCLALVASLLAGCGDTDNTQLRKRVEELEAENQRLGEKVDELTETLRPLEKAVHDVEESNRHLEKAIVQAGEDLRSRIHEMVQQERSGRRRGFVRPAPAVPVKPAEPEQVRPYMGFDGQTVTEELTRELKLEVDAGVLVTAVREGAPADVAGLKKDDVVQSFGEQAIRTKTELVAALAKHKPGEVVLLRASRGDEKIELKLKLGRR